MSRAERVRDRQRPLIWFHAPSVGEGLQARPVMQAIRTAHPDWQLAYTFFSPSAESFARGLSADIVDYLPFDSRRDMHAILDAIQPSALVFAKLDVWPTLVACAAARHIPTALISGTLSEGSGRRGWWSRQLIGDAYRALSAVGAIDHAHGERLAALGVSRERLRITGDTRFDQVHNRAMAVDATAPGQIALRSPRPTLVAGSTWPADEAVLFAAWERVIAGAGPNRAAAPRLIIAPHEPTTVHCARVEAWADRLSLRVGRYTSMEAGWHGANGDGAPDTRPATSTDYDVIIVDRIGVLGDIYAVADVALVGGGFHAAGLHSVLEPAAFGVPVLFGPRHDRSRDAALLLAAHGGIAVADATALQQSLATLFGDSVRRAVTGSAAGAVVQQERGATARSLALVEQLVDVRKA